MKRLRIPAIVATIVLLSASQAFANGFDRAMRQIILHVILVPFAPSCVALACALWLSRSNWELLCWPVLGGWVGAASVPLLIGAHGFWQSFLFVGMISTMEGVAIGLVALLVRIVIRRFRSRAKQRASDHEWAMGGTE